MCRSTAAGPGWRRDGSVSRHSDRGCARFSPPPSADQFQIDVPDFPAVREELRPWLEDVSRELVVNLLFHALDTPCVRSPFRPLLRPSALWWRCRSPAVTLSLLSACPDARGAVGSARSEGAHGAEGPERRGAAEARARAPPALFDAPRPPCVQGMCPVRVLLASASAFRLTPRPAPPSLRPRSSPSAVNTPGSPTLASSTSFARPRGTSHYQSHGTLAQQRWRGARARALALALSARRPDLRASPFPPSPRRWAPYVCLWRTGRTLRSRCEPAAAGWGAAVSHPTPPPPPRSPSRSPFQ